MRARTVVSGNEASLRKQEVTNDELYPGSEKPEENLPLNTAEKRAIEKTLRKNSGSRAAAARDLGISTVTLWRKMKKLGIAKQL